jgi:hypothetical protein
MLVDSSGRTAARDAYCGHNNMHWHSTMVHNECNTRCIYIYSNRDTILSLSVALLLVVILLSLTQIATCWRPHLSVGLIHGMQYTYQTNRQVACVSKVPTLVWSLAWKVALSRPQQHAAAAKSALVRSQTRQNMQHTTTQITAAAATRQ